MDQRSSKNNLFGILLLIAGVLLLFSNFNLIDVGALFSDFWPVIIILIGIYILFRKPRNRDDFSEYIRPSAGPDNQFNGGPFSHDHVFGDVNIDAPDEVFHGGSISNVFGDTRIDLSRVKDVSGTANLYVNGVFGSIKLILPKNIEYHIKSSVTAGDIELNELVKDGLMVDLVYQTPGFETAPKRINIHCTLIFGSIRAF